ncbi:MAG: anti-anti-sigma factor, partial [Pseudomonadales bacterium]
AKLAIQAKQYYQLIPMILSPNPNISRLLYSMGFDKVFQICDTVVGQSGDGLGELPMVCANEDCVRNKILEAHRTLMDLNDKNREAFAALVTTLEASR